MPQIGLIDLISVLLSLHHLMLLLVYIVLIDTALFLSLHDFEAGIVSVLESILIILLVRIRIGVTPHSQLHLP